MFKPILAIVLPCYNEEAVLQTTALRIRNLLDEMIQAEQIASDSFACFVDDGSSDRTWDVIRDLAASNPIRFRYVKLSRNYGHQLAILSGMKAVTEHCDCCVTIDADLQDDLGALREMVRKFQAGQAEIVLGIKRCRTADSFFKRWTAKAFYRILDLFGCKSIENHADFRLLSRKALRFLSEYPESNLFLRGIIQLLGLKTEYVYYDIVDRSAGTTKYTLSKMCNLALIGITSFSPYFTALWFFSLTAVYLLLMNPRTENNSYAMLAPLIGSYLLMEIRVGRNRYFTAFLIALIVGFIGHYELFKKILMPENVVIVCPFLTLVLLVYLAFRIKTYSFAEISPPQT